MLRIAPRIDMRLTDDYILKTISELLPDGHGELTYQRIAECCRCHPETVKESVRRLRSAGRIVTIGGKGRKPVSYRVAT